MRKPALMLQGTGSDVGKSIIAAGLIRAFTMRGLRVRPFQPQTLSTDVVVTPDGARLAAPRPCKRAPPARRRAPT